MNGGEPRISQDEDVRQAWHAASDESPPAHVDSAILAAARDAAQRAGRADVAERIRPWYRGWQPMLAAAAIAGLAFALLQTMPRDDRIAMPTDRAAPAGASPEAPEREMAQDRAEPAGKVESQVRRDATPASPAQGPVQSPALAASGAESAPFHAEADSSRAAKSTAGVEQPVAPPPPADDSAPVLASAPAPAPQTEGSLLSSPSQAVAARERASAIEGDQAAGTGLQVGTAKTAVEARIAHIVELYHSGDRAGAATELRALRVDTARADEKLPSNLRAWARTVH